MNKNTKNRSLLINIADKMREIDIDVWGKYIINKTSNEEYCIIDDLRFQNELDLLQKDKEWVYITLYLDENKRFVLLAAQSPNVGSFVIDAQAKTMEKYLESIRTICNTVLKADKELIIKLHPDPAELDITSFVQKIDPNIQVIKTGSISDLIRSCDVLVTIDISTVTL